MRFQVADLHPFRLQGAAGVEYRLVLAGAGDDVSGIAFAGAGDAALLCHDPEIVKVFEIDHIQIFEKNEMKL